MPRILNEIARRDLIFFVGEFLNCEVKGDKYKNAEIMEITDTTVTLRTAKGDIVADPNTIKPILKFGPPETSYRNVYNQQNGVVFFVDSKDANLYLTKGVAVYAASKKTTITVETTGAAIVSVTNYDDGKVEVSVVPTGTPPPANRPPLYIAGPVNVELIAELSKSPQNFGLEIIFTG